MTELSPQAQAVLTAFLSSPEEADVEGGLAAALRAAADHVDHDWTGFNCVDALYEIAAELEGAND